MNRIVHLRILILIFFLAACVAVPVYYLRAEDITTGEAVSSSSSSSTGSSSSGTVTTNSVSGDAVAASSLLSSSSSSSESSNSGLVNLLTAVNDAIEEEGDPSSILGNSLTSFLLAVSGDVETLQDTILDIIDAVSDSEDDVGFAEALDSFRTAAVSNDILEILEAMAYAEEEDEEDEDTDEDTEEDTEEDSDSSDSSDDSDDSSSSSDSDSDTTTTTTSTTSTSSSSSDDDDDDDDDSSSSSSSSSEWSLEKINSVLSSMLQQVNGTSSTSSLSDTLSNVSSAVAKQFEGSVGLDTNDMYCAKKVCHSEARGEPDKGKIAVLSVVRNRVKDKRWPNTVCGVVQQKSKSGVEQFTGYSTYKPNENSDSWQRCAAAAATVFGENAMDITGGADHFVNEKIVKKPSWAYKMKQVQIAGVGQHTFYKSV